MDKIQFVSYVDCAMKNTPLTPAPWFLLKNDGAHWTPIVISNIEGELAQASPIGSVKEQMANAKLIAASPELLQALLSLIPSIESRLTGNKRDAEAWELVSKARDAIKKATA